MDMPPAVLEQLLDAGPKCSSFRLFFLSFDRVSAPNLFVLTTVVWPMMMEAFNVMFS